MGEKNKFDAYKKLRFFFWLFGITETVKNPISLNYCIAFCLLFTGVIFHVVGATIFDVSFADRCMVAVCTTEISIATVKISVLYWNRDEFYILLKSLQDVDPQTPLGRAARTMFHIYFYSISAVVVSLVGAPMIFTPGNTPMAYWVPFINQESTIGFIFSYFLEGMTLACSCEMQNLMECFTILTSSLISHRLYLLERSIKSIGILHPKKEPGMIFGDTPEGTLTLCVVEHNRLMRLVNIFQKLVSIVFCLQTVTSTVILGLALYSASVVEDPAKEMSKFVSVFITLYGQLFIYCWSGQTIMDYCEKIHFAAYSCKWYELPVPFRKGLYQLQLYSTVPKMIKGWYIFEMVLATFFTCVQQSVSFFMIVRQFDS